MSTIFTDLLTCLEVPHTQRYSDRRFRTMPFQSLFGFSKLLKSYGIDNEGLKLADKSEIDKLPVPYMAQVGNTFVTVTSVGPETVTYRSEEGPSTVSRDRFMHDWSGVLLMVYPSADSVEPDYRKHRNYEILTRAKSWVLAASLLFLFVYLFIAGGLYSHSSTVALIAVDFIGLYITYLLLLKQLKIKSSAAERVCGVLEKGGCNTVLERKASKFFGLFGWSEVGFAYFSVSLLTLLIFPGSINYLALVNVCCLPFTVWSIWYQRFRAKAWCTLCVTVQCCLWLQFFCYYGGGWFHDIFPLRIDLFVLGATYLGVLLGLNRIMPAFTGGEGYQSTDE